MNILLAEDHPVYRDGISRIVGNDKSLQLVFETGDGEEALEQIRNLKPDVAVLDINMPRLGGLEIAKVCFQEQLDVRIVFLTMYNEREMVNEAIDLGVLGYVLKDSTPADILQAIHAVSEGRSWFSPTLGDFLLNRGESSKNLHDKVRGLDALSKAERRVLKLVASDMTSKQIAESIGVSRRTIDSHRANISAKLGISGSHSLLKFAVENRSKLQVS